MKKMSKRLTALVLVFVFILVLSGCNANTVAKVNKDTISQSQLDKRISKQNKINGTAVTADSKKQVLDAMIDELLTVQAAKKEGVAPNKQEIDQKLKEIKQSFKNDKEYRDALKEFGFTDKEMNEYLAQQISAAKLKDKITKGISVSDDEAKKYYEDNKAEMKQPESVKIRVILVNTEDEANKIIADLKSGQDFAQIAKEKSKDSMSKADGGLVADKQSGIEYWAKGQGLDQVFGKDMEDATFNLKKGEYSTKAIKGQNGFYIIKIEDKKEAKPLSFEEVKANLKTYLLQNKQLEKFNAYVADFKKKSDIKTYLK